MTNAARLICSSLMTWACGMVERRVWMLSLGRRDRLSAFSVREEALDVVREDELDGERGDLGGTGKTIDWMKLVLLVALIVVGVVTGVEAGDPERQDMQGARGKERRGQR